MLHAKPSFQLCSNWCLSSSFTLYLRYITSCEGCRRSSTAHLLNGRNLYNLIHNPQGPWKKKKKNNNSKNKKRTRHDTTKTKTKITSNPATTTTSATPATAHPPTTPPILYSYCYTNASTGVPPLDLHCPKQSPLSIVICFSKRFLVPTKAGLTRSDSWFKHKQAWNKSCRKTEESFTLKHTQLFMLPSPLDILTGFTSPCNMLILQIRRWDQQLLWTSSAVFVQTWYSPHFRGSNHRYLKAFWASNKLRNAYGGGLKATELTFCIILSCPFRLRHGKGVQCTDMHELTSKAPQHFSSWLV